MKEPVSRHKAQKRGEFMELKKGFEYSYTLGAFPTIEMLKAKPECVRAVYVHSSFKDTSQLKELCEGNNIELICNDKIINKLSDKDNVFVIGIFDKFSYELDNRKPQLVLVNPSDMGNLGTILRTCAGFGIYDVAIISPGADIFNPKVVRSSMGAIFRVKHKYYDSFEAYRRENPNHEVFTFMLNGKNQLTVNNCPKPELFSLVFGNEATGLDDSYLDKGTSIIIPQSPDVDSLNLTIAVGVGVFMFTH